MANFRKINWILLVFSLLLITGLISARIAYSEDNSFSQVSKITIGVHLRPSTDYKNRILDFNQQIGKDVGVIMYFLDWSGQPKVTNQVLDDYLIKQIEQLPGQIRPVVMLTWQPIILSQQVDNELGQECVAGYKGFVKYETILNGKCDNYLRMFAQDLAEHQSIRFILRFAHEMNIADSAWWPGHHGSDPQKYIEMWRYVHDIVENTQYQEGVDNIEWIWSVNYASYPNYLWNQYYNYYPGDVYVDWIGISGYNWGNPVMTAEEIYGNIYGNGALIPPDIIKDLTCRYSKPILIAEVGTVGDPTSKKSWINTALGEFKNFPFLKGVIWFNDFAYANASSADFRITGDGVPEMVTASFKNAIQSQSYISVLPNLSEATPPSSYCGNGEAFYSLSPATVLLRPGETTQILLSSIAPFDAQIEVQDVPECVSLSTANSGLKAPYSSVPITVGSSNNCENNKYLINININGATLPLTIIISENKSELFLPMIIR